MELLGQSLTQSNMKQRHRGTMTVQWYKC